MNNASDKKKEFKGTSEVENLTPEQVKMEQYLKQSLLFASSVSPAILGPMTANLHGIIVVDSVTGIVFEKKHKE